MYYTYILFSRKKDGALYTGITSDLIKRVYQHKNKLADGFTAKYDIDKLGYFEEFHDVNIAIAREKRMKKLYRKEKIALIEKDNPNWSDLYDKISQL
ncbi:MAG: GIY-YIG nuclease family protein [Proteobacteria bacterium]|nr:GIY-YIG nuclease family protein [Pseudomonadota bacterium]